MRRALRTTAYTAALGPLSAPSVLRAADQPADPGRPMKGKLMLITDYVRSIQAK